MAVAGRDKAKGFAEVNWTLGAIVLIVGFALSFQEPTAGLWTGLLGTALMVVALVVRRKEDGILSFVHLSWGLGLVLIVAGWWSLLAYKDVATLRFTAIASGALIVTALAVHPGRQAAS